VAPATGVVAETGAVVGAAAGTGNDWGAGRGPMDRGGMMFGGMPPG